MFLISRTSRTFPVRRMGEASVDFRAKTCMFCALRGPPQAVANRIPQIMAKPSTVLNQNGQQRRHGVPFYVKKKNRGKATNKLELKKYDPIKRQHVVFQGKQDKVAASRTRISRFGTAAPGAAFSFERLFRFRPGVGICRIVRTSTQPFGCTKSKKFEGDESRQAPG